MSKLNHLTLDRVQEKLKTKVTVVAGLGEERLISSSRLTFPAKALRQRELMSNPNKVV